MNRVFKYTISEQDEAKRKAIEDELLGNPDLKTTKAMRSPKVIKSSLSTEALSISSVITGSDALWSLESQPMATSRAADASGFAELHGRGGKG